MNAIICLSAPICICFFLVQANGGVDHIYSTLKATANDQINLIPRLGDTGDSSSFADFFVFIFIQWWSVYIVDNSDPNAQRHLQAESQFAAFKALFVPILITSLMFLFVSTIWDCGLLEYRLNDYGDIDKEAFYLQVALKYLPDGFKAVVLIAILFSFITTLESIINWGGGLLTIDVVKTYLLKTETDAQYRHLSFVAMLLVASVSLVFAYESDKIINLQKFIFSISAGVAPVFLLRWFWWRINAWTQISAMLSSLVFTLLYDYLYQNGSILRIYADAICAETALSPYALKIIVLTALVVCTWLTVMYCTPPDDEKHLRKFVLQTETGGHWPENFPRTKYRLAKRLALCLIFAITSILPFFFIWQFKFGDFGVGVGLLLVFIISAVFIYKSMQLLLGNGVELQQSHHQ